MVFVTKYRPKTLSLDLLKYLEMAFGEILAAWRCKLLEFGGEPDHVHLLVHIHPALDISVPVNNLRTASARRTRNRFACAQTPSTQATSWATSSVSCSARAMPSSTTRYS
ncbi:IS200/IS605 family transposase [Paraburkholderia phenoliruptrix]|uniref:IS200/IS605 family transposase n=1 Tax=Paraburkholderia phenoliruptrix TaxID=252970 RepID=UPI0035A8EEDF